MTYDAFDVCAQIREDWAEARMDAGKGKQCPGGYWIAAGKQCGGKEESPSTVSSRIRSAARRGYRAGREAARNNPLIGGASRLGGALVGANARANAGTYTLAHAMGAGIVGGIAGNYVAPQIAGGVGAAASGIRQIGKEAISYGKSKMKPKTVLPEAAPGKSRRKAGS